jgi:glutamyl-tRNA synthetase
MTVTRFAPSPTGYLHVGNLRTALFNHLIAKKAGGTFVLRLDDTDPERSKPNMPTRSRRIWSGSASPGTGWSGSRTGWTATPAADELRAKGRFYEAFETPTELDLKRKKQLNMGLPPVYDRAALDLSEAEKEKLRAERGPGVWRFKLDRERIEWPDGILGDLSIDAGSVSDPVLIRADGQVLYTLASVVDDMDMGITHVVRGSDHVTNTATQIQIIQALGGTPPAFAHHSLLTGPQGEALSKRLGTLSLRDLRAAGVEPMALLSLMARIGSSQPVVLAGSLDDLAEGFDLSHFGAAPTKFDEADLWPLTRACPAGDGRLGHGGGAFGAGRAGRSGPRRLGGRAREHHETRRGRRVVDAVPRRRHAAGRGRRPGLRGRGLRAAARAALRPGHLERLDRRGEGGHGPQGQGAVHAAAQGRHGRERGPEMADVMRLLQKKPTL